jgi:hypothetical protein
MNLVQVMVVVQAQELVLAHVQAQMMVVELALTQAQVLAEV